MPDRIIIMGNEAELVPLASANMQKYSPQADVIMYNDNNIGQKTASANLFLVGHASAKGIGDYDFSSLKTNFGDHLKGATTAVYLAGCSTADQAAQIFKDGFQAATLAANVKAYTGKTVYGTPGILTLTIIANAIKILATIPTPSSGYKSTDIFVAA